MGSIRRHLAPFPATSARKEVTNMAHRKSTDRKAASNAGKVLASKKSTKAQKSAAASALSQTKSKKRGH